MYMPARGRHRSRWLSCLIPALLMGCQTTPPQRPLDERAALAEVRAARHVPESVSTLHLPDAIARLRAHHPEIRRARADLVRAQRIASVRTPPPNPTLSVGPLLLGGADILSSNGWGYLAELGWSVILGGQLRLADELDCLTASVARQEVIATEREAYLALRQAYVQTIRRALVVDALEQQVASLDAEKAAQQELIAAGGGVELDARLLALEAVTAQGAVLDAEEARSDAHLALCTLLGLPPEAVFLPEGADLLTLPLAVPERARIERIVLRQHPKLLRLRGQFAIAEKKLRLEAARALPDIDLGLALEDTGADAQLSLPFGIELPVFPKGAKELAEAKADRERIRAEYTTTLGEILGAVDAARARIHLRQRRLQLIEAQRATADEAVEIARRARDEAGSVDSARYLSVLRASREVEAAAVEADAALFEAWMDLEVALGMPLVSVRDEPRAAEVVMPDEPIAVPVAGNGEEEDS